MKPENHLYYDLGTVVILQTESGSVLCSKEESEKEGESDTAGYTLLQNLN